MLYKGMNVHNNKNFSKAFTLIEIVVGSALFLTIALAAYGSYSGIFKLAAINQTRMLAVALADEQFENIRNMPYSNIGILNGIPRGTLPAVRTINRGGIDFTVNTTIRNIDLPFDGQLGSTTNDLSPADNKLVELEINCGTCQNFQPVVLSGQIAPKNLETSSTNGALFIQVFDSVGLPVKDANVHVAYTATTSPVIIDDTTNNEGMLNIVDVPPAANAYSIVVTKSGYSSDQNYPIGAVGNPDPSKPYSTVALQQITKTSFSIDKLASLKITSVTPMCVPVSNFDFNLSGVKQIGQNVPKYSSNLITNSLGRLDLNSLEWDSYTITPIDTAYDLVGINPLNPIILNAGASQAVQLVVIPKNPKSLLVTVKDQATQLPITGAVVKLENESGYSKTYVTGQGYISQTDWSSGSGQELFTDANKYWSDNGNVDTNTNSGEVRLRNIFGSYPVGIDGIVESSTFDTGTSSNFYSISWNPTSQSINNGADSLRLQFATNNELTPTTTWNYVGPDGTSLTYFNSPNAPLNAIHNGNRYARYKAFLSTISSTSTPNLSDFSFTYTSGCIPPGQVVFSGLNSGHYTLSISKTGYTGITGGIDIESSWQEVQSILQP